MTLSPLLRKSFLALAVVSFLGFADASYLTAEHYLKLPVPCYLTQGCETVLNSKYATIAGLPISIFGAIYYLIILFAAVSLLSGSQNSRVKINLVLAMSTAGLLVSSALVYLQFFVINQLCMYCLASATFTLILFALALNIKITSGKTPPQSI